jgi:hypothetical protein
LYGFSVPSFYGKGIQYLLNMHVDASTWWRKKIGRRLKIGCWLSWSQTIFAGNLPSVNLDNENSGRKKSILRLQFAFTP